MVIKKKIGKKQIILSLSIILPLLIIFFAYFAYEPTNIVEKTNFHYNRSCKIDDCSYDCSKKDCIEPYYLFLQNNSEYGSKISKEVLIESINKSQYKVDNGLFYRGFLTKEVLKDIIIERLNMGFLLDGIEERKLIVTKYYEKRRDDYMERELVFEDEYVGKFRVLMLVPNRREEKFPAVIGLHGHGDTDYIFRDKYGGIDLVKEGYIVFIPLFRAMSRYDNYQDNDVSVEFLLNGFNLIAIRIYEAMLVMKYALYLNETDNDNIGLIGHSVGSQVAILVARINDDTDALVLDVNSTNFLEMGAKKNLSSAHCQTIPSMVEFAPVVYNLDSLEIPVLDVPYAYFLKKSSNQTYPKEVIAFLNKNLKE